MPTAHTPLTNSPAVRPVPTGLIRRAGAWLSGADSGRLPDRVQRDLETQQRHNEILVGWVQAALILT